MFLWSQDRRWQSFMQQPWTSQSIATTMLQDRSYCGRQYGSNKSIVFGRLAQHLMQVPAAVLATQTDSDRYIMPNELKNLLAQTYLEIAFNSRRGRSHDVSFKVMKVFDAEEDKLSQPTSDHGNLQSNNPLKDQSTFGVEQPEKDDNDTFKSDEDILHTPIHSQIRQELFATEDLVKSTPPGFGNPPTIVELEASSGKKRPAQRELIPNCPPKKLHKPH